MRGGHNVQEDIYHGTEGYFGKAQKGAVNQRDQERVEEAQDSYQESKMYTPIDKD